MTELEWHHFVLLPSRERIYLLIVDGRRNPTASCAERWKAPARACSARTG
jgi:hypothetical protein